MNEDFIEVVTDPPTIEQEFIIEQKIREVLDCDDIDELKAIASVLLKQNFYQVHVLSSAVKKIAKLEKRVSKLQSKITNLLKKKFNFFQPLKSILAQIEK